MKKNICVKNNYTINSDKEDNMFHEQILSLVYDKYSEI